MSEISTAARQWKLFALVSQLIFGGISLGAILAYFAIKRWGLHWAPSLGLFFLPVILSFRQIHVQSQKLTQGQDTKVAGNSDSPNPGAR